MIIRGYRDEDEAAVYDICLRTGDNGQDATSRYTDPMLPGHVFAGSYIRLEPEHAFVLDDDGTAVGYVLGVVDTRAFEARCERDWWPPLRARYPDPQGIPYEDLTWDQRRTRTIHHPYSSPDVVVRDHPSHLHINLLPQAQRSGNGRRMLETLFAALAAAGSPGVHLAVNQANTSAIGFYRHLGFTDLDEDPYVAFLGRSL